MLFWGAYHNFFTLPPLQKHLKSGGIIGIITFLILWVFQPFGTYDFAISNKMLFLAGYGVITTFTYMAFYALGYAVFPKWFNTGSWNLFREVFALLLVLLLISFFCLVYHHWFTGEDQVTLIGYLQFLKFCLLVAVWPFAILYYQKWLQAKLKVARKDVFKETNESVDSDTVLVFESKNKNEEPVSVPASKIVWLKAEGNYVEIASSKKSAIKKQLIRNTLNSVAEICPADRFIQVHRSYIVNFDYVLRLNANGSNYELILNGFDITLPVSRKLVRDIREAIKKRQKG